MYEWLRYFSAILLEKNYMGWDYDDDVCFVLASIEILSKKYMFIIYKCIIYINELGSWIT
jgi:hypothetical protein